VQQLSQERGSLWAERYFDVTTTNVYVN